MMPDNMVIPANARFSVAFTKQEDIDRVRLELAQVEGYELLGLAIVTVKALDGSEQKVHYEFLKPIDPDQAMVEYHAWVFAQGADGEELEPTTEAIGDTHVFPSAGVKKMLGVKWPGVVRWYQDGLERREQV